MSSPGRRLYAIRFAELELNDAHDWYEHQQHGLGARFKHDVREAARRIACNPALFPLEAEGFAVM
ncbi:MAG: hypothetical protein RL695_1720 [Pseudomonadota bacterium]|jgi:hypothetical protein